MARPESWKGVAILANGETPRETNRDLSRTGHEIIYGQLLRGEAGRSQDYNDIATRNNVSTRYVGALLPLAFLAPASLLQLSKAIIRSILRQIDQTD